MKLTFNKLSVLGQQIIPFNSYLALILSHKLVSSRISFLCSGLTADHQRTWHISTKCMICNYCWCCLGKAMLRVLLLMAKLFISAQNFIELCLYGRKYVVLTARRSRSGERCTLTSAVLGGGTLTRSNWNSCLTVVETLGFLGGEKKWHEQWSSFCGQNPAPVESACVKLLSKNKPPTNT